MCEMPTQTDLSRALWRKSRRSNNGGSCVEVAAVDLSGSAPSTAVER
ncbi:DUF397 domain-containing protein [Actinoallomurus vinaceus]